MTYYNCSNIHLVNIYAFLIYLNLEYAAYPNYIKLGNFSKAVSEALKQCEARSELLTEEVKSLEFQKAQYL